MRTELGLRPSYETVFSASAEAGPSSGGGSYRRGPSTAADKRAASRKPHEDEPPAKGGRRQPRVETHQTRAPRAASSGLPAHAPRGKAWVPKDQLPVYARESDPEPSGGGSYRKDMGWDPWGKDRGWVSPQVLREPRFCLQCLSCGSIECAG